MWPRRHFGIVPYLPGDGGGGSGASCTRISRAVRMRWRDPELLAAAAARGTIVGDGDDGRQAVLDALPQGRQQHWKSRPLPNVTRRRSLVVDPSSSSSERELSGDYAPRFVRRAFTNSLEVDVIERVSASGTPKYSSTA
jgi:hypothetical protein